MYLVQSSTRFWWIEERAQCSLGKDARAIEAAEVSGRIVGMVAYDAWTKNSCLVHVAAEEPIVWRSLLRPGFQYPFLQVGIGLLVATVPAHNEASRYFTVKLGFRQTYHVRDGWAVGDDLIIYEMRREECRYLGARNGR